MAICAIVTPTCCLAQQASEAVTHAQRAQAAIAANNPQVAKTELEQLLRIHPNDVNALASLGMVEFTTGKYQNAARHFKTAVSLAPSKWNAVAFLGMSQIRAGDTVSGEAQIEGVLTHLTDRTFRHQAGLELVNSYLNSAANAKAGRVIDALLERDPDDPDILYAAYRVHSAVASAALQRLSHTAPDSPRLHQVLGDAFLSSENYKQALAEYKEALKLNPRLPGIHLGIGQAIAAQDKSPETLHSAESEFQAELQLDPQSADAFYHLAEIAIDRGDTQTAKELLSKCLSLRPGSAEAHIALGKIASDQGRDADAVQHLEAAVHLAPGNRTAHYRLAQLYKKSGDNKKAEEELEIARRLSALDNRAIPLSR